MDYNKLLENWQNEGRFDSFPDDEKLLGEVDYVLKYTGALHHKKSYDVDKDWDLLNARIHSEKKSTFFYHPSRGGGSRFVWALRLTAVFLVAGIGAFFGWKNLYQPGENAAEPVFREIVLEEAQMANITLSDGSVISLNASSKIRMPDVFSADKREVFLDSGEAYFDVAEDENRPFVIHSGEAVVQVLGTSFALRSYPEDEALRVVVEEGSVRLSSEPEGGPPAEVTLTARQLGRYFFRDRSLDMQPADDLTLYIGWKDGNLKFKDTKLEEVARQLQRRYDVDILFSDPALKELRLTAEFKSRSLYYVLNTLTASLGIEYTQEEWQRITFMKTQV